MPRGAFKHRYWFFADTPNVAWFVSVIWKDLLWRPDFTVISNNGKDVQYRCFNEVYDLESESLPDTVALLGINYCLQIRETGFAERFYASHTMGPAQFLLKISTRLA